MMSIFYVMKSPTYTSFEPETPKVLSNSLQTSRENETYPEESFKASPLPADRKIKVYSEYVYIGENLKHPRFEMVETAEEADVLWLTKSYKQFRYDFTSWAD